MIDLSTKNHYNLLCFMDLEVRFMKRTFQPNNRNMKKKHGFFSRVKGKVLNSRRQKGRKRLSK